MIVVSSPTCQVGMVVMRIVLSNLRIRIKNTKSEILMLKSDDWLNVSTLYKITCPVIGVKDIVLNIIHTDNSV